MGYNRPIKRYLQTRSSLGYYPLHFSVLRYLIGINFTAFELYYPKF